MLQILLGALGVKAAGENHLPWELGHRLSADTVRFRADFGRGSTGGRCRMALERFIRRRGPATGFHEHGICPLIEVRSESDLRRSPDGDHLSRSLDQGLSAIEI